jgi:hypothetical protein
MGCARPKTIDNDLWLPPGFRRSARARHVGVGIVKNLMEDSAWPLHWCDDGPPDGTFSASAASTVMHDHP